MKFAELLKEDGSLYLANLRSANVTDIYTPGPRRPVQLGTDICLSRIPFCRDFGA